MLRGNHKSPDSILVARASVRASIFPRLCSICHNSSVLFSTLLALPALPGAIFPAQALAGGLSGRNLLLSLKQAACINLPLLILQGEDAVGGFDFPAIAGREEFGIKRTKGRVIKAIDRKRTVK